MDKEDWRQANSRQTGNAVLKAKIKEWLGIDIDSDLFSPMVDYIFKRIFTAEDERSNIALLDLLNG